MPYYTPLRYPGGKRRLAPVVMKLLEANALKDIEYAEPYAGGAAIALALLLEEYASTIHINDLSRPVYAFWHTVLNNAPELCRRMEKAKITMREWHRQRAVYERRDNADLIDLGFAALFLNRTNRSGIVGGGVIGGKQQTGAWGLDARFNRTDLIQRILRIGRYRNRIRLYHMDALEFTKQVVPKLGRQSFLFYDPPYLESGEDLYLNNYRIDDHRALAAVVSGLDQPWVVTYDYAAVPADLYQVRRRIVYRLSYSAQDRMRGREVMFLSDRLQVPAGWHSGPIRMERAGSDYPIRGRIEVVEPIPPQPPGKPHEFAAFTRFMKKLIRVTKKEVDEKIAAERAAKRLRRKPA